MTAYCPNPLCHSPRLPGQYLCLNCWRQLPAPARDALSRRGRRAMARVRELHAQLEARVPLSEIKVRP
ncbi:hypothetical protein [Streptomyces lasiicapitis]|uniref:hypothetical protein n=1 Tax=Streptomyces lasiicapitis TaxID=1923961 RepID=UPI0036635532